MYLVLVAPFTVAVIMGVSGSGKSTIGKLLSQRLGWAFQEGDELHPPSNIAKLRSGIPLDDLDRVPWLARVKDWIDEQVKLRQPGIITCSALKRAYRAYLSTDRANVRLIYLSASYDLLALRFEKRQEHFMSATLLASQFEVLEPPTAFEAPIIVDAANAPSDQLDEIIEALVR